MSTPRPDGPIELDQQRRFWNAWNTQHRTGGTWTRPNVHTRQAQLVNDWISALGRTDLDLLEVGCGTGWLCEQLVKFGRVTGTDLANEVLPSANGPAGNPTFIAGDFFALQFPPAAFDVVVSLEVLAHVDDQPAYVAKIAHLLRPGGHLMVATQNKFALKRSSGIAPQGAGQIRKWVDGGELRRLLTPHFEVRLLTSIVPVGDKGILRLINSGIVTRLLSLVAEQNRINAIKERLLFGHTLMVLARKPVQEPPV